MDGSKSIGTILVHWIGVDSTLALGDAPEQALFLSGIRAFCGLVLPDHHNDHDRL